MIRWMINEQVALFLIYGLTSFCKKRKIGCSVSDLLLMPIMHIGTLQCAEWFHSWNSHTVPSVTIFLILFCLPMSFHYF